MTWTLSRRGAIFFDGDAVAQEIQLGDGDHALLQVEGQAVGGEDGEQCAEVGPVLLSGFAEDP